MGGARPQPPQPVSPALRPRRVSGQRGALLEPPPFCQPGPPRLPLLPALSPAPRPLPSDPHVPWPRGCCPWCWPPRALGPPRATRPKAPGAPAAQRAPRGLVGPQTGLPPAAPRPRDPGPHPRAAGFPALAPGPSEGAAGRLPGSSRGARAVAHAPPRPFAKGRAHPSGYVATERSRRSDRQSFIPKRNRRKQGKVGLRGDGVARSTSGHGFLCSWACGHKTDVMIHNIKN